MKILNALLMILCILGPLARIIAADKPKSVVNIFRFHKNEGGKVVPVTKGEIRQDQSCHFHCFDGKEWQENTRVGSIKIIYEDSGAMVGLIELPEGKWKLVYPGSVYAT